SAATEVVPTVALDAANDSSAALSAQASASAVIAPVKKVELSFPLSGVVKTVDVEAGDLVKAGDVLAALDTTILEARVREAEAVVVAEQTQVAYLIRTGSDNERLEAARADVERAEAAVEIAKAQLAQAVLTAPIDGTVASVEISPAEFASPGQVVVVIGDLTRFQVETTDKKKKDAAKVKAGQSASIFVEALNQTFTGKVKDIARISETVGGDVVFKVTIEFDNQPEGLRWGMSADVKIAAE
ncbi:MAG: efflux RND transporter periplasmic adaptor subunit, partial [Chloroflexi bacterium]|nr:efflux RND transporter periplasmic adaptor subunit [Chloroflexota bacterium]